jgi:hypothetical protein
MYKKTLTCVAVLFAAITVSSLLAGCSDETGEVSTPEPETVLVTSEKTVEVPVTIERTIDRTVEVTAQPMAEGEATSQAAEISCNIGQECNRFCRVRGEDALP